MIFLKKDNHDDVERNQSIFQILISNYTVAADAIKYKFFLSKKFRFLKSIKKYAQLSWNAKNEQTLSFA